MGNHPPRLGAKEIHMNEDPFFSNSETAENLRVTAVPDSFGPGIPSHETIELFGENKGVPMDPTKKAEVLQELLDKRHNPGKRCVWIFELDPHQPIPANEVAMMAIEILAPYGEQDVEFSLPEEGKADEQGGRVAMLLPERMFAKGASTEEMANMSDEEFEAWFRVAPVLTPAGLFSLLPGKGSFFRLPQEIVPGMEKPEEGSVEVEELDDGGLPVVEDLPLEPIVTELEGDGNND